MNNGYNKELAKITRKKKFQSFSVPFYANIKKNQILM